MIDRRLFIQGILAAAAGNSVRAQTNASARFGRLVRDPTGLLDLPKNLSYQIISRKGDEMGDGFLVPARADGMAAFAGQDGNVIIVCNHENHSARPGDGPFGATNERLDRIDPDLVYDLGESKTPCTGGTTTKIYNPESRETVSQHLSLAGTEINCAGGPTPWRSWLSCEESFGDPGPAYDWSTATFREKRHGYVFEVSADSKGPAKPLPLREMGRFLHEAAAVNPMSGVVYMTEDQHRSLLYRYIPNVPRKLEQGGRLQALAIAGHDSFDTRNWADPDAMKTNEWLSTRWIDLIDVDSAADDLRLRGFEAGAARFARGEGLCYADGSIFMTATIGGSERLGQVFEYRLSQQDGTAAELQQAGQIRILAESTQQSLLRNADNLTMSPWGDLIVCEDSSAHCGLVGIRRSGDVYEIADNSYTNSELAGICFSPDGSIMFVNIQDEGLTLAITGPWRL